MIPAYLLTNNSSSPIQVTVRKLHKDARVPTFAHKGDSGADLYAINGISIPPYSRALVHTGIALDIPEGYEGCIRPRSGNALKEGYTVLNSPGTIDNNYLGEICVIIFNTNQHSDVVIRPGDRIAQIVIQKLPNVIFDEIDKIDKVTERGTNGFGSTNVS